MEKSPKNCISLETNPEKHKKRMNRFRRLLRLGIRSMSPYGDITVPNPTPSVIIFHKNQKNDDFITLQAQTRLLDGSITSREVDNICQKVAEFGFIKHERCRRESIEFLDCVVLSSILFVLMIPLMLSVIIGTYGFFIGVIIYSIYIVTVIGLKSWL